MSDRGFLHPISKQLLILQLYIPPTDKDQLLLELQKPPRLTKALQALFDDRCLGYIKKDAMMEVLKDLVKTNKAISKAQNKAAPDAEGKPFNLLQMIIRYSPKEPLPVNITSEYLPCKQKT